MKSETAPETNFKLSNTLVLIMAIACGVTVANLYYIQPLLSEIARAFSVNEVSIGSVAMLTQIGYAVGMLFLLPLADIREKRLMIVILLICASCALILMGSAFNITLVAVASFAVGFTSVVPQLVVPLSAELAEPEVRGKIIGTVFSGLLIGILLSRTFSGVIGGNFGWRIVYFMAAAIMLIMAIVMRVALPVCRPTSNLKYGELIKSIGGLIKTYPVLREAAFNGAMMFAAFSIIWTSLTFLLENHYNMGAEVAGLFGLVGIAGALASPMVGRIADKKSPKFTIGIAIIITIIGYIFFLLFGFKIWGLIIGIILVDLGVQSCQVSNQARIQALNGRARNRINTVFMVSYFIGGAFGSFFSSYSYMHFGWIGVCILGLITQAAALISYKVSGRK
ncbi:arabinose efflux permease family protein [Clostridium pasteurianum DSM 525 = ATCC 6013]|uniref:Arabinose efflux permease family protein n=1 Tax=Clostridium pasteurianum DSM 525 = ATCC 6013 TaxID=1262449 RepID=A0A0H3J9W1_CLOPA|nr:MFS transporter [Clostridium pasteurianum]AJA49023.1 arabinose efflux permease family protein [Clostridium pasteurianum DSM 525 = ATCC 6013]AJA53011.1 arabinose efflux permease family protein [Clostridium pasteurianum DSM 525 = ATCC 6013]AOZ77367.1 MFS transporter permease [Clostridium pasteurianum DSM 525 = ATCC 6013]AOZ81164.1 MFS transporter permease [Clostridium pasteurianum]ELP60319.1 arabinose efflux permease family protein [Clostridium pasteurianum DSM 525 = ATCC 6013]